MSGNDNLNANAGRSLGGALGGPDHGGSPGGGGGGNTVQDLLHRAAQDGPPPEAFRGGDEKPVIRHLTFWRNGFTVEDGDLYRYDDPANERILNQIHSGRAPNALFNVRTGQPVEVLVSKKTDEDYVAKSN